VFGEYQGIPHVDVEACGTIASNVWRKPTETPSSDVGVKFADMVFVVVASSFACAGRIGISG